VGQFKHGQPHGVAVTKASNVGIYSGLWDKGRAVGVSLDIYPDGNSYHGLNKDHKKHGLGVFKWKNGEEYCG